MDQTQEYNLNWQNLMDYKLVDDQLEKVLVYLNFDLNALKKNKLNQKNNKIFIFILHFSPKL